MPRCDCRNVIESRCELPSRQSRFAHARLAGETATLGQQLRAAAAFARLSADVLQ
jgi:hypothetical protein